MTSSLKYFSRNTSVSYPSVSQYCSEIFGWFPPLVFSIMVQNEVTLAWALTVVASIFSISIFFLLLCGPWEKIVEQAQTLEIDFSPEGQESLEISGAVETSEGENDKKVEPEKVAAI